MPVESEFLKDKLFWRTKLTVVYWKTTSLLRTSFCSVKSVLTLIATPCRTNGQWEVGLGVSVGDLHLLSAQCIWDVRSDTISSRAFLVDLIIA